MFVYSSTNFGHTLIIGKVYQTGRKVAEDFKLNMRILFDTVLPQWNYRALPNQTVI